MMLKDVFNLAVARDSACFMDNQALCPSPLSVLCTGSFWPYMAIPRGGGSGCGLSQTILRAERASLN